MPDECFGVAAVGLEHFGRLVPGDIHDLDQVRASVHRFLLDGLVRGTFAIFRRQLCGGEVMIAGRRIIRRLFDYVSKGCSR
jgi:hypothetical protein